MRLLVRVLWVLFVLAWLFCFVMSFISTLDVYNGLIQLLALVICILALIHNMLN